MTEAEELEYLELLELEGQSTPVEAEPVELITALRDMRSQNKRFDRAGNRLNVETWGGASHLNKEERKELNTLFDLEDALVLPRQDVDKLEKLQLIDPSIEVSRVDEEKDVAYVNWRGKEYALNKEGFSTQDLTDLTVELGTEIPLMALGGLAGASIKGGSILARATGVGAGAGSSSVARDISADVEVDAVNAGLQTALAGSLDLAIPKASKAIGGYFKGKSANRIMDKFEIAANTEKARGITDYETIVSNSLNKIGVVPSELKWATEVSKRSATLTNFSDVAAKRVQELRPIATKINQLADKYSAVRKVTEIGETFGKKTENALGVMLTAVNNISPKLAQRMNRYEHKLHQRLLNGKDIAREFSRDFKTLSGEDQKTFSKLIFNGDKAGTEQFVKQAGKERLLNSWTKTRGLLDELSEELRATGHKMGNVESYFPRAIEDQKAFDKFRGVTRGTRTEQAIRKFEQKNKRPATKEERVKILSEEVRIHQEIPIRTSDFHKQRSVGEVTDEYLPFYTRPDEQLDAYLHRAISYIEKGKFLGTKVKNEGAEDFLSFATDEIPTTGLKDDIFSMLDGEVQAGRMTWDDVAKVQPLLQARFGKGEQFAPKSYQSAKNVMYAWTLGTPLSALTQVGDVALSAQINGITNTIGAVARTLGRRNQAKIHDIGVDLISHEFSSNVSTARALDSVLKWTGFKSVDKLGKTVHINASLAKNKKLVNLNNPKGTEQFIQKYKDAFTEKELTQVMSDLRAGKKSDLVNYVLWNDLTRAQPIALSQMPPWYLEHPKGRIMYMLKTFTIKQFDLMRREAFQQIARGNVTEGTKNLVKFATLFTGANASVSQVKDWLRGRDSEFSDTVIANLHKNWGGSDYLLNKMSGRGTTGAAEALVGLITPPISAPLKSFDTFADGVADNKNAIDILESTAETLPLTGGYLQILKTMFGSNPDEK